MQQTFCNAIERLDGYRGEAALYTWFCQICRNVLADHFRRKGRGAERVVLLEDQPNARAILESLTAPVGTSRRPASGASSCTGSSKRRSIRCRAATAKYWNGNTSTASRSWRSRAG